MVLTRNAYSEGTHRFQPLLWDFAKHCGFIPKLCAPYRAQTKGKVERFIGYLRRSFYVPLKALLAEANMIVDETTANQEVKRWLQFYANQRVHATTEQRPIDRWHDERQVLLPLPANYALKNAVPCSVTEPLTVSPLACHPTEPLQHDLTIYQQLLH